MCPRGYYCHQGDDVTYKGQKQACPRGTYGARTKLTLITECTDCLAGYYCEGEANVNVTAKCDAGYYCKTKAFSPKPSLDTSSSPPNYGPCPEGGYYCVTGSEDFMPCAPGRYAPEGLSKIQQPNDCTLCASGSYCAAGNQSVVSGPCSPGYYCLAGSPVASPTNVAHGAICPAGFKCPQGSKWPQPCVPGTYNNESGQAVCKDCPEGFYCSGNTTSPAVCPAGYYCPKNTITEFANECKAGYFNNLTGRADISACQSCTPGYYCDRPGIVWFEFCFDSVIVRF